jgi:hypothetical protein
MAQPNALLSKVAGYGKDLGGYPSQLVDLLA